MVKSLLIACLFLGLISMILPDDRRGEWVRLLLIVVLMISLTVKVFETDWKSFPFESEQHSLSVSSPEKTVLHHTVSDKVKSLTGVPPLSVESDFAVEGEEVTLSYIYVVIRSGNGEEVQNALRDAFSFGGITVVEKEDGSD